MHSLSKLELSLSKLGFECDSQLSSSELSSSGGGRLFTTSSSELSGYLSAPMVELSRVSSSELSSNRRDVLAFLFLVGFAAGCDRGFATGLVTGCVTPIFLARLSRTIVLSLVFTV